MQQKTLDKIIYSLALIPLLLGLSVFFYWYYQRVFHAVNVEIEIVSFLIIVLYILSFFANAVLSVFYWSKFKSKRIMPGVFITVLTIPIIFLIGTLYDSISEKVFLKIINSSKAKVELKIIRSENFEFEVSEKNKNNVIISYIPVYKYFYFNKSDSFGYEYEINQLVAILEINGKNKTINLPKYEKGMCVQLDLVDLIE